MVSRSPSPVLFLCRVFANKTGTCEMRVATGSHFVLVQGKNMVLIVKNMINRMVLCLVDTCLFRKMTKKMCVAGSGHFVRFQGQS